ncbi:hypothetical protein BH23ACT11_BH23ACT11_27200 [soil metagenome]
MKTVGKLDQAESIFLEDLLYDYEGIWRLARMVSKAIGTEEPATVREVTLKLAKDWLVTGLVRAGAPNGYDPGFSAWPEEGEEAAARIAAEWSETESLPLLGEVTWFAIAPEGERLVKERLAS